jgi:hypothetical protein
VKSWQEVIAAVESGFPDGDYEGFEKPNEVALKNATEWCAANLSRPVPNRVFGCDGVIFERYEDQKLSWYVEFDNHGSKFEQRYDRETAEVME